MLIPDIRSCTSQNSCTLRLHKCSSFLYKKDDSLLPGVLSHDKAVLERVNVCLLLITLV